MHPTKRRIDAWLWQMQQRNQPLEETRKQWRDILRLELRNILKKIRIGPQQLPSVIVDQIRFSNQKSEVCFQYPEESPSFYSDLLDGLVGKLSSYLERRARHLGEP